MGEKPLDPTNQADWEKFGKKFEADFDALESEQEEVKKAESDEAADFELTNPVSWEELKGELNADFDTTIGSLEALEKSASGTERGIAAGNRVRALKNFREEVIKIIDRPELDNFKRKREENPDKLIKNVRSILARAKKSEKVIDYGAMEAILAVANRKNKTLAAALENAKINMAREAEEKLKEDGRIKAEAATKQAVEEAARIKAEEDEKAQEEAAKAKAKAGAAKKKKKPAKPKTKLEKEYVDFANNFLEKGVSFCYREKREEKKWTGYNQEVFEFVKFQFEELAKMSSLEGDSAKVEKAWELIAGNIEEKINALEEEIKKESQPKMSAGEEYMKLSPEDVWNKLDSAGASEEDKNYFFNLDLQGRIDFLMCSEDELREKIKNLKEKREGEKQLSVQENLKLEQERKDARIKKFAEHMKNMRTAYLQKEYELNNKISKLKRVFKMDNIDLGNAEKDLKMAREEYKESVEYYIKAIMHNEGINDKEELEIMFNYFNVQEALNLQEEKMEIRMEKDPKLLQLTDDVLGKATRGYLTAYKTAGDFMSKKFEGMADKTNSKILKKLSGFGGKVAFGLGIATSLQGFAPYWAVRSVLLATSVASMTMEKKAELHKELKEKETQELAERKIKALNEISANVNTEFNRIVGQVFKREFNLSLENEEGRREKNIKIAKEALIDSIRKTGKGMAIGFIAGEIFKDIFGLEQPVPEEKSIEQPVVEQQKNPHGSGIHNQATFPFKNVAGIFPEQPNDSVSPMSSESEEAAVVNKFEENSIVKNQEKIQEALNAIRNQEATPVEGGDQVESGVGQPLPEQPDTQQESQPQAESKASAVSPVEGESFAVQPNEYDGIVLNESGQGVIEVLEGKGIKDTIKQLLIDNKEKLTAGKMGWNPDNYTSLEDWADRRAVGIVAELKAEHPDYNYDKVSLESKITLDMSNPADIKIVNFVDGRELENTGGNTVISKNGTLTFDKDENNGTEWEDNGNEGEKGVKPELRENDLVKKEVEAEKSASQEISVDNRDLAAKQEIKFAYRLGITPEHYAQINNITVAEFIEEIKKSDSVVHGGGEDSVDIDRSSKLPTGSIFGNGEASNRTLGRVLNYLMQDGKITNPNQSVAEVFRNVSENDLIGSLKTYEGIFGNVSAGDPETVMALDENKMYAEYMSSVIKSELNEMLGKNYGEGRVMRELAAFRGVAMRDLSNNELLMAFKEATKQSVGELVYKDNESAGKYVLSAIRKAYETGTMEKLRDSIASIDTNKLAA